MRMFELLPRPLGAIFRKLTHLTCNLPRILISGAILYFNDLREQRVTVENAFDNPVLSHADIIQKLGYCINFTVSIS